ncbi:MAG: GYD domain-containing protein [Haloferacaceae archaeon]
MPTYISLIDYTQKGIENMRDSPERLEKAKEVTESVGGEYRAFYLTMGGYDAVYVADFPDAESAAQALLTVAGAGAVQTETLRAFSEDEYRDIIDGLP